MGSNNPSWSGNTPTYRALHKWVHRYIEKSDICPCCEENMATDCANYTGIYDRNLDNYVYICKSCHGKLDFILGDRKKIFGRKKSEETKNKISIARKKWWNGRGD